MYKNVCYVLEIHESSLVQYSASIILSKCCRTISTYLHIW